ncbi:MAG: hypothetical protein C5B58_10890 [Acidobacteria bacterium]|nr:MAG: hypothetical protein C5B58_10890 [Acidobacteriota bacterium]
MPTTDTDRLDRLTDANRPDRLIYYFPDENAELRERTRCFGRDLRRLRRRRGMTQRELERAAGLGPHDVSTLESGLYDPTWTLVEDLAAALGMSLYEFASPIGPSARRAG